MQSFAMLVSRTFNVPYMGMLLGMLVISETSKAAPTNSQRFPYYLMEELPANTRIGNLAVDAKLSNKYSSEVMRNLTYLIQRQVNENDETVYLFDLDQTNTLIETTTKIDRDVICPNRKDCLVYLDIAVQPPPYSQVFYAVVDILDTNDHIPTFPDPEIYLVISESTRPGTVLDLPAAFDPDTPGNSIEHYELISSADKFELKLSPDQYPTDVRLIIREKFDREEANFYQFRLVAYDGGNPPKFGSVLVNIEVEDENSNDPAIQNATYEVFVMENTPLLTTIGRVNARDSYSGDAPPLTYRFSDSTKLHYGHLFGIEEDTGAVYVKGHLDFEMKSKYQLMVIADDPSTISLPAHVTLVIKVEDDNDHAPNIKIDTRSTSKVATISENSVIGTFVAEVVVTDPDEQDNGRVKCFLADSNARSFQIVDVVPMAYLIVTTGELERDTERRQKLNVICHDLGKNQMTSTAEFSIRIISANNNSPTFRQTTYTATIVENNNVGDAITVVSASDPDEGENGVVRYKLTTDASTIFNIHPTSGIITTNMIFDHEVSQTVDIKVIAFDLGTPISLSSTSTVILTIIDTDDEPPTFTQEYFAFGTFENQPPGTEVGAVSAKDLDGPPYNQFNYRLMKGQDDALNAFSISPVTGHIYTKAVLDREDRPVYYMTALVTSLTEMSHSSTASVTIYVADKNDNDPVITWPSEINNTIYISDQISRDDEIVRIHASDQDLGGNGKLSYNIEGDTAEVFDINIGSGVLTIKKDLSILQQDSYELSIIVQDHGFPKLTAKCLLRVIVNSTTAPSGGVKGSTNIIYANNNITIIVSLTSASLILIFLLIVAIILVKKQQQEKKTNKCSNDTQPKVTNGRTETHNMLATRENAADGRESVNSVWSRVKGEHNLASSATMESCYQPRKAINSDVRLSIDENNVNLQAETSGPHVHCNKKRQNGDPRLAQDTLTESYITDNQKNGFPEHEKNPSIICHAAHPFLVGPQVPQVTPQIKKHPRVKDINIHNAMSEG